MGLLSLFKSTQLLQRNLQFLEADLNLLSVEKWIIFCHFSFNNLYPVIIWMSFYVV